jgi:YggT family protein
MTPLGNLLNALAIVLDTAINISIFLIFARVVISWVMPNQTNPVIQTVHAITEPFLFLIRKTMSRFMETTMIDLSPIVAFFILTILQMFLVKTLFQMASSIQF